MHYCMHECYESKLFISVLKDNIEVLQYYIMFRLLQVKVAMLIYYLTFQIK